MGRLDDGTIVRLAHAQSRYFEALMAGTYDQAYVRGRLRVGVLHQHIGLALQWYIGAYRKYISDLMRQLAQ